MLVPEFGFARSCQMKDSRSCKVVHIVVSNKRGSEDGVIKSIVINEIF